MKLTSLPLRTRKRLAAIALDHRLDVHQAITVSIDVLYAALYGFQPPDPPSPRKPKRIRMPQPESVGKIINAAIAASSRPHPLQNSPRR